MLKFKVYYLTRMPADTSWLRAYVNVSYPVWNEEIIKSLSLAKIRIMNFSDRGTAVYRFEKIEKDI